MRRKISFIIGATLVAGILAIALRNVPAPFRASVSNFPSTVSEWLGGSPEDPAASITPNATTGAPAQYAIGPEAASLPEIRVWAIRAGNNYGWIQLPKGTPVRLLREEGAWLVVRYDESVVKIHRSVAEAGLVVPVMRGGRLAAL
jgi:hypothetical protein